MRVSLLIGLLFSACGIGSSCACAIEPWLRDPASSSATEANAVERIPFQRLKGQAQENIRSVVERPSYFRRLPTQTVQCDPDLFILLVRNPEIIVNIWDLMGITKVEVQRIAPYVFTGTDGAGTTCRCELLYGTSDIHVYYGTGTYSGALAARDIDGRCVCVLHSSTTSDPDGRPMVTVSMDVFMKLDNFGADLLTRTLAPLVGKTADYNFIESAKFVSQLNELCLENPMAAAQLAQRLDRVDPAVRTRFSQVVANIAASNVRAVEAQEFALQSNRVAAPAAGVPMRPSPREQTEQSPRLESRPVASASLSDGGVIVPVKPPVSLRR